MRSLLTLVLCLLLLPSCFSGGGGSGLACYPVHPVVGELEIPGEAALKAYAEDLSAESYAQWAHDGLLPAKDQLEGLSVRERQLYTYRRFFPDVEDLISKPGTAALKLTTFGDLGHEHEGAAYLVAQWFHYELDHTSSDEHGRTTYFLRGPADATPTRWHRLWIANWALEQFPTCLLYGGEWRYHAQGGGGAI